MNSTSVNTKTSTTTVQTCIIKATTWNEDGQSYTADGDGQKFEQEFEVCSSTDVSRTSIGITMGNAADIKDDTHYNLFNLAQENGVFTIKRSLDGIEDKNFKGENVWKMMQSVDEEGAQTEHVLREGDILKLGKVKLRVRELRGIPQPAKTDDVNQDETTQAKARMDFLKKCQAKPCAKDGELACRICLDGDQDEKNPLVSPCSCTGSVSYVHLDCVRHWIKSKCRVNVTNGCTVYIWKDLDCELCHQSFPDLFDQEESMIELVELIKPTKTYMILETMPEMKKFKKIFYVAHMSDRKVDKTFTLGRKLECQININDPSVSRLHSIVKYSDGKFILKNRSSTFGTLVLLKEKLQLRKDQQISMKIGKSILTFNHVEREVLLNQEVNEVSAAENNQLTSSNIEKFEISEEEEKKYDYYCLRKDSLLNTANLSFDFINSNSISGMLPIPANVLDQPEEERIESQPVHTSFDEIKIKDELENLDRLSTKIKKILEECYRTLEDSEKKTQGLYSATIENQYFREEIAIRQDDTLAL